MAQNIDIFDNDLGEAPRLHGFVDSITVSGKENAAFVEERFNQWLAGIEGKDRVTHVFIKQSAHLRDCEILQHFPNTESLTLHGRKLVSISGIRHASRLTKLLIDSGRKNRIAFNDEILGSSIEYLRLQGPRKIDLEVIGKCQSIRRVEFFGGELTDFDPLSDMRLRELAIIKSNIKEIRNIDVIQRIEELWLTSCKDLHGFVTDSTKVREVTIELCPQFDAGTLQHLKMVTVIRMLGLKAPIDLDKLSGMKTLRELMVSNCKVTSAKDPLHGADNLRKLFLSPAKSELIRNISEKHRKALVFNGTHLFIDGIEQRDAQAYYEQS